MKLIVLKTNDGQLKGNTSFYCRILQVSRQGFYKYLINKDRPWNYQPLSKAMQSQIFDTTNLYIAGQSQMTASAVAAYENAISSFSSSLYPTS